MIGHDPMRTFDFADASDADEDELAAAVAAVSLLLAEAHAQPAAAQPAAAWRAAALLEGQGMAAGRSPRPAWASAERGAWPGRSARSVVGS